ncbi:winged helix-turn-helix domain-containing protein [Catellatospora tritici]|uniref:winged helix-turn-helix domain-containing protein n=1 Tax=Catellatospora tritici TaxID=2851566 RepID=UPI001C2D3027|nr:crosslink repair DNA glycosylase YcaQ family protein [Catellatospora tritici]MBV1848571.1 winged helix DNA-binding domain-containing protein [Catellatospora tritici]
MTIAQARRMALAAQGFTDRAPKGAIEARHLRKVVVGRTGLLQIDSVNVLQRAHYLPVYSRLGAYDPTVLDSASARRPRWLFEYWGHEASLLPVQLQPLFRWRMARAEGAWGGPRSIAVQRPDLVAWVLKEVGERGPVTAAQIEQDVPRPKDNWGWNWSDVKKALEWLFYAGDITSAGRTSQFARLYDLTDRVLPAAVVHTPTPEPAEAYRRLVELSARGLGVAAEPELRDYFRLPLDGTRAAIADLAEEGVLVPVEVRGWKQRAWRHRDAAMPRRVSVSTLVSPFDPLIWERGRTERLFDLRYRIEIYVPQEQRVHGYYVLPFLHGDRFAARVDLKADRRAGVLRVPAAWAEPGVDPQVTAQALAVELRRLADWLGLSEVAPPERGDLASALADAGVRGSVSSVV